MSAPYADLTKENYLEAAQALLPRGPAWPRDDHATLTKYLNAVATVIWLAHKALTNLFVAELDPATADDLLPDWEEAFGVASLGTKSERRARLTAAISNPGGFTAAYYVAVAHSVGVAISLPTRTGPFTLEIQAPILSDEDRAAFEAFMRQHNRATCIISFIYTE